MVSKICFRISRTWSLFLLWIWPSSWFSTALRVILKPCKGRGWVIRRQTPSCRIYERQESEPVSEVARIAKPWISLAIDAEYPDLGSQPRAALSTAICSYSTRIALIIRRTGTVILFPSEWTPSRVSQGHRVCSNRITQFDEHDPLLHISSGTRICQGFRK